FVAFGYRQAAGALAIVAGALLYATAARHALRSPGPPPGPVAGRVARADTRSGGGLRSPTGEPDQGGSGSGVPGERGPGVPGDALASPRRPWVLVNPRAGDGKAGRVGLVEAARARGVRVHLLAEGDDPGALARRAVVDGADAVGGAGGDGALGVGGAGAGGGEGAVRDGAAAVGVAGGDGSLGVVAAVAVEADVPFVCVPSGTRNHFAGDLGLGRSDPVAERDRIAGPERRVDVGMVGDRMFMNNVSLGAYADL